MYVACHGHKSCIMLLLTFCLDFRLGPMFKKQKELEKGEEDEDDEDEGEEEEEKEKKDEFV